jgi:hypothetical protein
MSFHNSSDVLNLLPIEIRALIRDLVRSFSSVDIYYPAVGQHSPDRLSHFHVGFLENAPFYESLLFLPSRCCSMCFFPAGTCQAE